MERRIAEWNGPTTDQTYTPVLTADLRALLALARSRPPLIVTEEMVEAGARALAEFAGFDPEYLEPGDCGYSDERVTIDGRNAKGEPCHFIWRQYDPEARAALTAALEAAKETER